MYQFNMKILGIDYGLRKIGLAVAEGKLAEPLKVIRVNGDEEAVEKVKQVVQVEQVEQVIIGISEGKTAEETKKFSQNLKGEIRIPVELFDETLSTHEAQELSRESGMNRKKRKNMEDAFAACIMLQNYLDK